MPGVPRSPAIFPTSGFYKSPLAVSISGDVQEGDALFYVIETKEDGPVRHKYIAPFLLSGSTRFCVSAFVWRDGVGEGPRSSAIYVINSDAPQAAALQQSACTTAVLHKQRRLCNTSNEFFTLQFFRAPPAIRSMETFDVELGLSDQTGCDASASYCCGASVVLSAELFGDKSTCQVKVPLVSGSVDQKRRCPPFVETSLMMIDGQPTCCSLSRVGGGGSWNAYANTAPCIGTTLSGYFGVSFRVVSLCRAIVGLHSGLENAASELSWRLLQHSFHVSADLSDPNTVPAFRIYELGKLIEEAGTVEFALGDELSIETRSSGDVVYLHNKAVVHISSATNSLATVFSLHVRIANQQGSATLSEVCLLERQEPFRFRIGGLLFRPDLDSDGNHSNASKSLVLRAFITGTDYVPAVARIPVVTSSLPRWAFAAISLSSMFALGAVGSQSGLVAGLCAEHLEGASTLMIIEELPSKMTAFVPPTTAKVSTGTETFSPRIVRY